MLSRVYARRGVPTSLRAELWLNILNVRLPDAATHFDMARLTVDEAASVLMLSQLREEVLVHAMFIDQVYLNDVKECCNDDIYFVFEVGLWH